MVAGVVLVVIVGGLAAWTAGAFDTNDDDPPDDFPTSGSDFVVPLGAPVEDVASISWPVDAAGEPRAATAIEEPRAVQVTVADQVVLTTPSQTILLHQRDGQVSAVDLQPQAEAGSVDDAVATLRRLLDDHDLLDRTTEQELDDWAVTELGPDPLLGDQPSLRVTGPSALVFAQLRPISEGDWFLSIEVALPVDGPDAT